MTKITTHTLAGEKNIDINDILNNQGADAAKALINSIKDMRNEKINASIAEQFNNFSLDVFALNGDSEDMRSKMLEDKFVAGNLAILGQVTFWYARPNAGKTLLILWMIIDAINRGEIKAQDVYHINADDSHKGLTFKTSIAEQWGFKVISPSYKGFKAELLGTYLNTLIQSGNAKGKVIILDTVKKFADIMDKRRGSTFGEAVRQFSMHGGTIIGLAHVNKHNDANGNVVYSGTSDLVDDCDCAYTLDIEAEDKNTSTRTVKFKNIKNRGDVALEAFYKYNFSESLNYQSRLNSVRGLSVDETAHFSNLKQREDKLASNREAIEIIKNLIKNGTINKTDIIKALTFEGITRKNAIRALKEHEGKSVSDYQFWQVSIEANNAHVYKLNLNA